MHTFLPVSDSSDTYCSECVSNISGGSTPFTYMQPLTDRLWKQLPMKTSRRLSNKQYFPDLSILRRLTSMLALAPLELTIDLWDHRIWFVLTENARR